MEMFNGIYEELGMVNTYDVWYFTPKRQQTKRKSFITLEEATKWCKQNKNKVKLHSGSWQVLSIMKSLK